MKPLFTSLIEYLVIGWKDLWKGGNAPQDTPKPPQNAPTANNNPPVAITSSPESPNPPDLRPNWRQWYIGPGWKEYAEEGRIAACKMTKQKCVEAGFPNWLTNELLSTLQGESGYNVFCVNRNEANGKVVSTDFGICQLNDIYYLQSYNMTGEDALNNPEKDVDIMISAWKAGRQDDWVAHRNGAWRNHQDYPNV